MSPWWNPVAHADRRGLLVARNRIKAALRAWFGAQGFQEVEPDALCVSPGNETHLHAFATEARAERGGGRLLYLHTSPEFALKKLLAAGEQAIFAFAPVYRNREGGSPLHAAEFTMLEWYRADAPYTAVMADCAAILCVAAEAVGSRSLTWRGRTADPFAAPEALPLRTAFQGAFGFDLAETLGRDGAGDREALAALLCAAGVRIGAEDDWSDLFSRALVERIEPGLGLGAPAFLTDYPACEAALARVKPEDPRFAERFELYACGVELANGFGELTDPAEQRRRFEREMAEKQRRYGERYPLDEDFLTALSAMPPASGCALGFDRLVMLLTGAPNVSAVRWAPIGA